MEARAATPQSLASIWGTNDFLNDIILEDPFTFQNSMMIPTYKRKDRQNLKRLLKRPER